MFFLDCRGIFVKENSKLICFLSMVTFFSAFSHCFQSRRRICKYVDLQVTVYHYVVICALIFEYLKMILNHFECIHIFTTVIGHLEDCNFVVQLILFR